MLVIGELYLEVYMVISFEEKLFGKEFLNLFLFKFL